MSDLRAIIRIKTMATAAAEVSDSPGPDEGVEMAAAYARLREQAAGLNKRAGWGDDDDDFAREVPPLALESVPQGRNLFEYLADRSNAYQAATTGRRARVLLGQLAAWAAGHQEAFELEEQMKANAAARAATQARRPPGFGTSQH